MKKGILFDLDGTLWDSAEGVVRAWNFALAQMNRPERTTLDEMYRMMGKTTGQIAGVLFPGEEPETGVRILERCMKTENDYLREHGGRLFDGLEDTMRSLKEKGYFLGIVSNCEEGYIEAFLAFHGLEGLFDDTESYGHTGHEKGYNIRLMAKRNRLTEAFYLGDTQGDCDAAGEAGIPFLHAAYGFGSVPAGTPSISDIRRLPEAAERMWGKVPD